MFARPVSFRFRREPWVSDYQQYMLSLFLFRMYSLRQTGKFHYCLTRLSTNRVGPSSTSKFGDLYILLPNTCAHFSFGYSVPVSQLLTIPPFVLGWHFNQYS